MAQESARLGDAALAAHVMVIRIVGISFLPGLAVSEAVGVLVGLAIGARRMGLLDDICRAGVILSVGLMLFWTLAFSVRPELFLAPFGPPEEVAALALGVLMVAASFQVFDGVAIVVWGALTGAGDTRFTLRASAVTAWTIKLPLGWFCAMPMGMGLVGAWMGIGAEILVLMGVGMWRLRNRSWLEVPRGAERGVACGAAAG